MKKGKAAKTPYTRYRGHFSLPAALLASDDMKTLSGRATKLLVDLGAQYSGYNNGSLIATLSALRDRGWTSNDQVLKAKRELLERNLIMQTRSGGLRLGPDLYAFTWQPIQKSSRWPDVVPTTNAARPLHDEK